MGKGVCLNLSMVMVLLVGSVAMGDPIIQTEPFSGIPSLTETLTFDQFDNVGGTLTLQSVEVIFQLEISGGQLVLDNDGLEAASGSYEFGAKGNIASTDVSLVNGSFQPVTSELGALHDANFSLTANVGDGSGDYDPNSPDGLKYDGGTEDDSDSGFISPLVFVDYIGTGTYDIDAVVTQWQEFGGVSGIEWAVNPVSASGSVTVIYNYIPEPAALSLLALGGLALIRRRK